MSDVAIQRFGSQGSTREFPNGRFDVLELHGVSAGRAPDAKALLDRVPRAGVD